MTNPVGRHWPIAAVALAYVATALPGLFPAPALATASPLWLPTGVALIAALLGGGRCLLGVGLGAFLVNLWVIGGPAGWPTLHVVGWAAALAAAAILQAVIGSWLVRRLAGFPSDLVHGRDIVRFMAVAGPLTSLVSATYIVWLLCLSGTRPWDHLGPDWVNAWAGDTFGVLLVSAVALPFWAEPREVWRPRVRGVSLPVVGLFLAVMVLFAALRSIEEHRLSVGLGAVCNESTAGVRAWFKNAQVGMKAWNEHVAHTPEDSAEQRSAQARSLLGYHDTLRAVGCLTAASERTTLTFWHSRDGAALPPGLDFDALPHAAETLRRASASAEGAAVALDALGLSVGRPNDLLVVRVIRAPAAQSGTVRGYSFCVVDMAVVEEKATRVLTSQHIASSWIPTAPVPPDSDSTPGATSIRWKGGAHVTVPIVLAGQPGAMTYFAGDAYLAIHQSRYLSWILLLGLAITALIAGQLLLVTGETALVGSEVRRRTAELQGEIAERLRTEQSLRESAEQVRALHEGRNRLRALIENTPAAVAMFDRPMRCLAHSRRWLTDYRLGERNLIGLSLAEVFPDLPETWKQVHVRCLAGAAERCDEDVFPRADGTRDYVRWSVQPWHDDDGSVGGTIFFTEVITQQKQLVEERRRLEEKLRETQKLESLGVLAGGIAHDFNNLLTGILGYAHLARSCLPPEAEVNPFLVEIEQSSRRAAELCQQMLAYAGKGKFVIGPLDLGELVQDVTKLLQLSIVKKAELTLSIRPQLPAIEADANQMRQVVMNLVMNASDALDNGTGSIRIETSVVSVGRRQLDAMLLGSERPPGDYVCLQVTDTGGGMDEATKARIFEPFFTTKFAGRGLGLAAVLGIIRGHHGALSLQSAPGQGTTFRLLFPPLASSAPALPVAAAPTELSGQGTILVADDEEMVRQVTVSMTASLGFQTIEASDGEQAVEQVRRNPSAVRAVLLDLTMPRLDGLQAFAEMRGLAPHLPILVMSGYTELEVKSRFPGDGPAAFLQKPFSRDDLAEKLKEVLT